MTFDFVDSEFARSQAVQDVHFATAIYTTSSVVEGLMDRLGWPRPGVKFLDPAAGDGAFVLCALARLKPAPGDFQEACRVRGFEFHPGAVAEAQDRVCEYLRDIGWSLSDATAASLRIVVERDFLAQGAGGEQFTVIGTNPPYLRYARLPAYFKDIYGQSLRKYALADLLHAFLDRVCEMLPQDGVIGAVTADRWLFNETAARLRSEIGRQVGLTHVERLDVSTSFYRPKVRKTGSLPRVHPVEVVMHPAAVARFPITANPISPDGFDLAPYDGPTLKDVAEVRLAPWLGPHGIFVVDEATAAGLPEADLIEAVDTDDIDRLTDKLRRPSRFAIRTCRKTEPTGAIRDHLLATCHAMPKRGKDKHGRYWIPPERIKLRCDRPSLLIPRIATRLRAIALPASVLPINHNLNIVSVNGGASIEALQELLASEASHQWLKGAAPRLEGGHLSVTTKLLRRLPVPTSMAPNFKAAA